MAPQNHHRNPPDPYEQEWAIRELKKALQDITVELQETTRMTRANHDDIISIKTRWGMVAALAGGIAAIVVKILPALH